MSIRSQLLALAWVLLEVPAVAQCGAWSQEFGGAGVAAGEVRAAASYDAGAGPELYIAGYFTSAGGYPVSNIARWDGARFYDVGGGVDNVVNDLVVWDDGGGAKLYACGHFLTAGGSPAIRVARWDGATWQPVGNGLNGEALCLAVHDDGGGPALYVGGHFANTITNIRRVGKLVGSAWTPLPGIYLNDAVEDLASFDDGSGPALVATGIFTQAGGTALWYLAAHRGAQWGTLGTNPAAPGLSGGEGAVTRGRALAVRSESGVPALYVGGNFTTVLGVSARHVARFGAGAWSALGTGIATPNYSGVTSLAEFDDGSGSALFVGGNFAGAGPTGAQRIARWHQGAWGELATGLSGFGPVEALAAHDDGSGPALYLVGGFSQGSGATLNQVARWNGAAFTPLGGGQGVSGTVRALAGGTVGGVTGLFVANDYSTAGDTPASILRRWDGLGWTNIGSPMPHSIFGSDARALRCADLGAGLRLLVGGTFDGFDGVHSPHVIAWTGSGWESLGAALFDSSYPPVPPVVLAIEVLDFGGGLEVVVGGLFNSHANIARIGNGQTLGLGGGFNGIVRALAVYDAGSGARLYAGGTFSGYAGGGASFGSLAVWDGLQWAAVGTGIPQNVYNEGVYGLHVFDDGSGPALYVGGRFTVAGGAPADHVARWNGTTWSALGSGMDARVTGFAVHDEGGGPRLHAVGDFTTADGVPAQRIARWEGGGWSALGGGLTGTAFPEVLAAASYEDSVTGPSLAAGGTFGFADGFPSANIASRSGCAPQRFCFGDGTGTACPCGNHSPSSALVGCLNSLGIGGELGSTGVADVSADTLVLRGSGMPATATALYFQGTQPLLAGNGAAFGDGLRCAGGSIIRLGARVNVGGASGYGGPLGDVPISVRGAIPPGGGTFVYQVWYRNIAAFCTPSGFNLSNGLSVPWRP